jgi:chloride channel protein, CIC family
MLPLLVSCFRAYAIAEYLKDVPIYKASLKRDLIRGRVETKPQKSLVVEFDFETGALFAEREVGELGLSSSCILARCYDGERASIPKASARVSAHRRISAMISCQAVASLQLLRQGCAAKHG